MYRLLQYSIGGGFENGATANIQPNTVRSVWDECVYIWIPSVMAFSFYLIKLCVYTQTNKQTIQQTYIIWWLHKYEIKRTNNPFPQQLITGEQQYNCVSVHKRSTNVLEFQIGSKTIHQSSLNDNGRNIDNYLQGGLESICSDQYFDKAHFITQVRLDSAFEMSPCPIDGEFVGLIPDAEGEGQNNSAFPSKLLPILMIWFSKNFQQIFALGSGRTVHKMIRWTIRCRFAVMTKFSMVSIWFSCHFINSVLKGISQLWSLFFLETKLNLNLHRFRTILYVFVSFM